MERANFVGSLGRVRECVHTWPPSERMISFARRRSWSSSSARKKKWPAKTLRPWLTGTSSPSCARHSSRSTAKRRSSASAPSCTNQLFAATLMHSS